jgi:hypothetical protein
MEQRELCVYENKKKKKQSGKWKYFPRLNGEKKDWRFQNETTAQVATAQDY